MREILNPFSLDNKTILVTGASSGIGKETAISCSKIGANVFITGRNNERLNDTFSKLEGDDNLSFLADLNNKSQTEELVNNLPKLDGLVLNAGIMRTIPFKFVTSGDLENMMSTNFMAPILLINLLIKNKKLNKNASIIFISSIGGVSIGTIGNSIYCASKGAINGIQKVLAVELAKQNIRVNSVNPGMVKTEMWNKSHDITTEQLLIDERKYPLGYGEPKDVANACIYLLSDASKWVTGINLTLDGGFTIQ
ncbi:SDR family NAD(P)-dependent oxidoreductase [Pedobacter alpinus]|uniref:SDR family NAD(P)-dependent oxidoreductase n=1 Tax=Pedobacter alpinus TaxID=1590643 RepID=A0ABW5TP68_9SPHI